MSKLKSIRLYFNRFHTKNLLIFIAFPSKMNICQLLLLYLLLINGILIKVEAVNKKLQKSFVEIFGEGWDEEERREEIGKVTGDWQNDDKQIEKNDQRETMTAIGDQTKQETSPLSGKTDQNDNKKGMEQIDNNDQRKTMMAIGGDQTRPSSGKTDQDEHKKENGNNGEGEKREIIRKWHAIKERIKQRKGKQSRKEWHKIDKVLAKKLATNRNYIYKWIKELGMTQIIRQTNEGRLAIVKQYWEMKQKDPKMSDAKIAKALKISERSIQRWRGKFGEELGMGMKSQLNVFTEEQKREIVGAFNAMKEKIKRRNGGRKYSREQWAKMENLLSKKLGTNRCQIYKWIKELGMNQIKMRTDEEKLAIIKKYWEMKRKNPKMSERKIAKRLNTNRESIRKWKDGHLGEKTAFLTDPPT